jgi:hypothetical protein
MKLVTVAIGETRQTEWAKEVATPVTPRGQRYGNTLVGPPATGGATTWLRIVRRASGVEQRYTAATRRDGLRWVTGVTWTHALRGARLGLGAMGGAGHTAAFTAVRAHRPR